MKRDWDTVVFRSLDSFGVAGQLLPHAEVYSTTLFSTKHVGRTSDLFAAKLERSATRELSLRCAVLFPVFEACRSLKELTGRAFTEPLTIECGVDEEKLAIGIGFIFKEALSSELNGLLEKKLDSEWNGTTAFDAMIRKMRASADHLILKFEPAARRVEIVAFIGVGEEQSTELSSVQVITFTALRPVQATPKPRSYIDLGDLDYPELLGADALGIAAEDDASLEEGTAAQRVAGAPDQMDSAVIGGIAARAAQKKLRSKKKQGEVEQAFSADGSGQQNTNVKGSDGEAESSTTVDGAHPDEDQDSIVSGDPSQHASDSVLVDGSTDPSTASSGKNRQISNKNSKKKKDKKSFLVRLSGGFRNLLGRAPQVEPEDLEEELEDEAEGDERVIQVVDLEDEQKKTGVSSQLKRVDAEVSVKKMDAGEGSANSSSETVFVVSGGAGSDVSGDTTRIVVSGGAEKSVVDSQAAPSEGSEVASPDTAEDASPGGGKKEVRFEMDPAAAAKALEMEDLDKLLANARREAAQMKNEVKSPKFASWMDGLVSRLSKEKTRLAEASRKVALTARLQELEFNKKIAALGEENRQKDFAVNQKSRALMRVKEQLAAAVDLNQKNKANGSFGSEDSLVKQKLLASQTQLLASKDENALLIKKVEELKRQAGTGMNTKTGASTNQYAALHGRYERLFKQSEELKRTNRSLVERVNDPRVNRVPTPQSVGADEYKRRLDASMQVIALEKKEKEAFKARFMATQQDQVKLRDEIRRLMTMNRQLATAIQQRQKGPGDSGGVPPASTPPGVAA